MEIKIIKNGSEKIINDDKQWFEEAPPAGKNVNGKMEEVRKNWHGLQQILHLMSLSRKY